MWSKPKEHSNTWKGANFRGLQEVTTRNVPKAP